MPKVGTKSPSGPSARRAAQLKYHPPANYIRHYLGDDRYKIDGGVWKVVSTQLDTYYHRASCPNMLKQSADIVIGFSGSADAEESGYRADPVCQPRAESAIYGQAPGLVTEFTTKALPLTLADGSTRVTMPVQWKRTLSRSMDILGMKMSTDTFQRKGSSGQVGFITFPVPNGGDAAQFLQQRVENPGQGQQFGNQAFLEGLSATNPQLKGVANSFGKPKKIKLGDSTAYSVAIPAHKMRQGNKMVNFPGGNFTIAAKGTKLYMIFDSDGSKGARSLVNSFR